MRIRQCLSLLLLLSCTLIAGCMNSTMDGANCAFAAENNEGKSKVGASAATSLTDEELAQLLSKRLDSGISRSFASFSNMFFVFSNQHIGKAVGLATSSKAIASTTLQSPFPHFYQPTLKELLDAIALQTASHWNYDRSGKFIDKVGDVKQPVKDVVVMEFSEGANREKPFEVQLAKGWKTTDHGNWVMYSPPDFPIGMDIYEMGSYSASDKAAEPVLMKKVEADLAFEWAKRVQPRASRKDLKPAKVGAFHATYFESTVPSQMKRVVKWRQWAFTSGNKAYLIVSTIFPESDDELFPAVQAMVKTFRVK